MKLNIIFSEYKNTLFLGLLLFLMPLPLSSYSQTQATILNDNPTDQEILNALSGGGLSMSNPQLVWGNRDSQIAIFDNGFAAGFNFNQGILFSTGNARADLESHNNNLTVSRTHGSYSDPDLTGLVSAAVNDPVIFTFDLTLDSNQDALRIAFQFGSEEYPNYVASAFNDVFGFFVSGPGITETINMARLPGSNGIVAINSVNGGYVGYNGSCTTSPLDLTQTAYFVNNGHSIDTYMSGSCVKQVSNTNPGPKPVFIEYNGLTALITYYL